MDMFFGLGIFDTIGKTSKTTFLIQSTEYLPVTVYIEDINDNAPVFESKVYNVTIDENTPPGLTIFRGIQATDRDKPNTPNSDIKYSILTGNVKKKFSLEGNQKAVVVLRKPLDFEAGDNVFNITITAEVIFDFLIFLTIERTVYQITHQPKTF